MAVRPSATFFFNSGKQGWSERYWYPSNVELATLAVPARELLRYRSKMLCRGVEIPFAYLSYDDVFRDVLPIELPLVNAEGYWNNAITSNPEQPNVALAVRCYSGTRAGKFIYLSGIPDTTVAYPPLYAPVMTGAFKSAFEAYLERLLTIWGWKGVSYDVGISPLTTITTLAQGSGEWVATVASAAGFLSGKTVRLFDGNFTGPVNARPNRNYRITNIAGNVITLAWGTFDGSAVGYLGGGKLQMENPAIFTIDNAVIEKITTRKRGVGWSRPLGRRKGR